MRGIGPRSLLIARSFPLLLLVLGSCPGLGVEPDRHAHPGVPVRLIRRGDQGGLNRGSQGEVRLAVHAGQRVSEVGGAEPDLGRVAVEYCGHDLGAGERAVPPRLHRDPVITDDQRGRRVPLQQFPGPRDSCAECGSVDQDRCRGVIRGGDEAAELRELARDEPRDQGAGTVADTGLIAEVKCELPGLVHVTSWTARRQRSVAASSSLPWSLVNLIPRSAGSVSSLPAAAATRATLRANASLLTRPDSAGSGGSCGYSPIGSDERTASIPSQSTIRPSSSTVISARTFAPLGSDLMTAASSEPHTSTLPGPSASPATLA